MRRFAAPVSESRSARSWTWRSRTALRRLSAAIDAELVEDRRDPSLDAAEDRPRPVLDDDRADRPAVGDHRRDEDVPAPGRSDREERVAVRVEPA